MCSYFSICGIVWLYNRIGSQGQVGSSPKKGGDANGCISNLNTDDYVCTQGHNGLPRTMK